MARQQKNTSLYSEQLSLLLSTIVQTLRHDSCHWVDTTRQAVLFGQSGESVRCRGGGPLAVHARLPYSIGLFSQEVGWGYFGIKTQYIVFLGASMR
jgi:hypothetical protein